MSAWMTAMYSFVFIALVALVGQVKSDCTTAETCLSDYSVMIQNYDWQTVSKRNDTCTDLDTDLETMKTCVDTELDSCSEVDKVTTIRNMEDTYIQNIEFYSYHCTPGCEDMPTKQQELANCTLPLQQFRSQTLADAAPYCRAVQGALDCQVALSKGCSILEDAFLNMTVVKQAYGSMNAPPTSCGLTLDGQAIPALKY